MARWERQKRRYGTVNPASDCRNTSGSETGWKMLGVDLVKLQEQQRKRLAESEIRLQLIKEGVIREGEEISVPRLVNAGMRSVLSMPSSPDVRKQRSANVLIAGKTAV